MTRAGVSLVCAAVVLLSLACSPKDEGRKSPPASAAPPSTTSTSTPTPTPEPAPPYEPELHLRPEAGFVDVALGLRQGCAFQILGRLACWGEGSDQPIEFPNLDEVVGLGLGASMSCALKGGGEVWCWEPGPIALAVPEERGSPARAMAIDDALSLHAQPQADRICAYSRDDVVRCWSSVEEAPARVPWSEFEILAPTRERTCGVDHEGGVACWLVGEQPSPSAVVPWLGEIAGLSGDDGQMAARSKSGKLWRWNPGVALDISDFRRPFVAEGVARIATSGEQLCALVRERGTENYVVDCWSLAGERQRLEGVVAPRTLAASPGRVCVTNVRGQLWCWDAVTGADAGAPRLLSIELQPDLPPEQQGILDALALFPEELASSFPKDCPVEITRAKTRTHSSLLAAARGLPGFEPFDDPAELDSDELGAELCNTHTHGDGLECPDGGPWYGGEYQIQIYVPESDASVTQIVDAAVSSPGMEALSSIEAYKIRATDPLELYVRQEDSERRCADGSGELPEGACGLHLVETREYIYTRNPANERYLRVAFVHRHALEDRYEDLAEFGLDWFEGKLVVGACGVNVVVEPEDLP